MINGTGDWNNTLLSNIQCRLLDMVEINMSNLEMQNLVGLMLVTVGLCVFVVLTQILDVIQ